MSLTKDSSRRREGEIINPMGSSNVDRNHAAQDGLLADVRPISSLLPSSTFSSESIMPVGYETRKMSNDQSLDPVEVSSLNVDQKRAYDIVMWHLDQTLRGDQPPPLRMLIHGEGGTGKSCVLQTITEGFKRRRVNETLLKAAYTGVAASNIDGQTLHSVAKLSIGNRAKQGGMSDVSKAKLQDQWRPFRYLMIDEFLMVAKRFLANFSRNVAIAKAGHDARMIDKSFGGVNVILSGDIHQFPPVATSKADSLYMPIPTALDSTTSQIGRQIYEEFNTVVILREQKRIKDKTWHEFLQALRFGHIREDHLEMLRSLLIQRNPQDDYSSAPWNDAILITPRHGVRTQWNDASLRRHCSSKKRQLFICPAQDRIWNQVLSSAEQVAVKLKSQQKNRQNSKKDLPEQVRFAIGAKVLVTQNIDVDIDVTNGARGEIVLHPDKPPISHVSSEVHLQYLPLYILVKMARTRASRLPGLEDNVVPIQPASCSISISLRTSSGGTVRRTVQHRQFPMTLGYALTDYRAQGQTIPYVIIDIARPPSGKLDLFNLYVALSRSRGRHSVRLLRDFDDHIFLASHDTSLMQEDDRLERLDDVTKRWWQNMN